ncbi:MAG: alginate O-acetyltransferase complex protein AlgI [Polyangiales bacterium]|jgi:alginate O-acetyltransferase complex protein AlgI
MFFHSLDYMLFLGLALTAFWWLATHVSMRRMGFPLVLLASAVYFGRAWDGDYFLPIMALVVVDFLSTKGTLRERVNAFLSREHAARVTLIFVLSCAFYMAWQANYIWLILASTCLDYFVGLQIPRAKKRILKRALLSLSLVGNLGLLFAFKYYNFFAAELGEALAGADIHVSMPLLQAALPVGISFYTFQTLSYTIDIYRGTLKPARDFITFAAFVSYFPQLVAGPIVRASELLPQLESKPRVTREQISDGLFLIATGLVKKFAIADYLALGLVDRVFVEPEKFTALEVVVALYAFTMQLYCDFSGYTDVARGSAKLMGFEMPKNFDRPYQATNPAEFWRRWHMTLSRWLRDYLYFPLGGSRKGPVRAYWNLYLTMFLVGIWHGNSANFMVFFWYANLQAVAMLLHRLWNRNAKGRGLFFRPIDADDKEVAADAPSQGPGWRMPIFVFLNLQFVVFSRILFRAGAETEPMEVSASLVDRILHGSWTAIQVPWSMWVLLIVTFALHFTPTRYFNFAAESFRRVPPLWKGVLLALVAFVLMEVGAREALPFQYFQF